MIILKIRPKKYVDFTQGSIYNLQKFESRCGWRVNSLAPGKFQFKFRSVMFKLTLVNGGWGISYEIALRWMPLDLTDDKLTLVQVMAWCRQATSHYLSQCWLRSMSPNGVTRPQWVKRDVHKNPNSLCNVLDTNKKQSNAFKRECGEDNDVFSLLHTEYISVMQTDPFNLSFASTEMTQIFRRWGLQIEISWKHLIDGYG